MAATPQHATVGVISCHDGVCPGHTLLSVSRTTYLIDKEGRVLHTWASKRDIFVAYLLQNGNLLRDGSDLELAPQFAAGGASGYLEEVTWHNEQPELVIRVAAHRWGGSAGLLRAAPWAREERPRRSGPCSKSPRPLPLTVQARVVLERAAALRLPLAPRRGPTAERQRARSGVGAQGQGAGPRRRPPPRAPARRRGVEQPCRRAARSNGPRPARRLGGATAR